MSQIEDDGKTEVRVTLFADPIRVHPSEVGVLRSQGLLVEDAGGAADEVAAEYEKARLRAAEERQGGVRPLPPLPDAKGVPAIPEGK